MNMVSGIQRAIDYIDDNICERLDYEIIASKAFLSSYHFQRLFSITCGLTMGEYIRYRRLSLAGYEIENTDNKIIDIALKYGYETPESFSRAYSRFHGASPMVSRNQRGIIKSFAKISVQTIIGGNDIMQRVKERGYTVKENGPVYYTNNMDRTVKWFEEVLGWYAGIDQRNDNGDGIYGCLLSIPGEISNMTNIPFNGFHMFYGEPSTQTVAFMRVDSIHNLHEYIKKSGWDMISEIETQHWGGKECNVTTIDGFVMRFFQLDSL